MSDPKDPTDASTIEEKQKLLSDLIKESVDASAATEELTKLMEKLRGVILNISEPWGDWTGNLDQVKDRMAALAAKTAEIGDLNEDQINAAEVIAFWNSAAEENAAQRLTYEGSLEKSIREQIGLTQRLTNNSKIFTGYEIQRLKSYSDMVPILGAQGSLFGNLAEKQAEITKDLYENINAQQASIIIRGKAMKAFTDFATKAYGTLMQNVRALAQMNAELNKLNTSTTDFGKVALEASEALDGVSLTEVGNTVKELATNMSTFVDLTKEEQEELTKTVNIMERLGISVSNQIAVFDSLTKGLGMTNQQGQEALRSLESFGKRANIPMAVLDKNLGAVGTKLAAFGKEGYQKVFESLSVAAKNLAIDIGKLVQVTEQLTTFEGAAKMAGELNAVLGRNLVSSMGLLEASMKNPIEVFEQIKTAMDASGRSFDEMGPAMQRHIAGIFGMEVTEAQRLFNMSLGEATTEMEHNAKTQAELAELAAKSADAFKRLEIAFQKIMSSPLVGVIIKIAEGFAYLFEAASNSENIFGMLFSATFQLAVGFVLAVTAIAKLRTAYTTFSVLMAIARGKEVTQQTLATRTMDADTLARWRNVRAIRAQQRALLTGGAVPPPVPPTTTASMFGAAAAILAIGVAVGIAALAMVPLIEAFAEAGSNAKYARDAIVALVVGITIIGVALAIAAPFLVEAGFGLAIFGAGLLTVGITITGVVLALAALAAGFGYLMDVLNNSELKAQAEADKARADALKSENELIKTKISLLSNLTNIELNASKLDNFATGLGKIAEALGKLPDNKLAYLQELNNLGSIAVGNIATSVDTAQLSGMVQEVAQTQVLIKENIQQNQTMATNDTTSVNQQPQSIKLTLSGPVNIDGAELGTLVYNGVAYYMEEKEQEKTKMLPTTKELKNYIA